MLDPLQTFTLIGFYVLLTRTLATQMLYIRNKLTKRFISVSLAHPKRNGYDAE